MPLKTGEKNLLLQFDSFNIAEVFLFTYILQAVMIIHPHTIHTSKVYSRIVSLVPSQTELLYDLQLADEVIAITKFCVHPSTWFKNKTRIGGTKNVKIDLVKQINPDLIIANKEENIQEQVEALAGTYDTLVTDVTDLKSALQMIKDVGILTGKTRDALAIARTIENKFQQLHEKFAGESKIKTAYLVWKDPYMAAGSGTFINDMMAYCGMENVFFNRDRYPQITGKDLQGCELVLLSSEPYPFEEKHIREIQAAIPAAKIMLVDGEMFSWYGSRLIQAAGYFEMLRNISYNSIP